MVDCGNVTTGCVRVGMGGTDHSVDHPSVLDQQVVDIFRNLHTFS